MYYWLMRYAETFGEEFPLRYFSERNEYDVLQIVMDCCMSRKPYRQKRAASAVIEEIEEAKEIEEVEE
jgi:hypothetical protein